MKKYFPYRANRLLLIAVISVFTSCASTRHIPYFEDLSDSSKLTVKDEIAYSDPLIKPDDILSITIVTIDPSTSAPVNQAANLPASASSNSGQIQGLLVDKDGNVSLPILGTIKVAGLSTFEAKALVKKKAELYFKDPDVQLRFANFKISVLGEVAHPSVFVMPSEKVTVLDALSLAGDLTIYGRRENVLVIRDVDGKKQMARLNLNKTDIFTSPFFYLKQNDVVYVEPNGSKIVEADAKQTRIITIAVALTTSLIVLLLRLSR